MVVGVGPFRALGPPAPRSAPGPPMASFPQFAVALRWLAFAKPWKNPAESCSGFSPNHQQRSCAMGRIRSGRNGRGDPSRALLRFWAGAHPLAPPPGPNPGFFLLSRTSCHDLPTSSWQPLADHGARPSSKGAASIKGRTERAGHLPSPPGPRPTRPRRDRRQHQPHHEARFAGPARGLFPFLVPPASLGRLPRLPPMLSAHAGPTK